MEVLLDSLHLKVHTQEFYPNKLLQPHQNQGKACLWEQKG